MPVDPSPLVVAIDAWKPRANWASTLRPAYERLVAGAQGFDATAAWSTVVMMMGDTRGAELALVCCLHAETLLPDGVEDRRVSAHKNLCLLDLGLASAPGPIAIKSLGDPGAVDAPASALAVWLSRALTPWQGDLAAAAWFCLRIAAVRTGVIEGPEPHPV